MEIGFRKDLRKSATEEHALEIEDQAREDFPRQVFCDSWAVLFECEELTRGGDDSLAKQLCDQWDNLEICLKYEKRFNLNVHKAVQGSVGERGRPAEPEAPSRSTVPDLNCFSGEFCLDEAESKPRAQKKYQRLSALRLKRQLCRVLFSQHNMIENPFILDFKLHNWSLSSGFQAGEGALWLLCRVHSNGQSSGRFGAK